MHEKLACEHESLVFLGDGVGFHLAQSLGLGVLKLQKRQNRICFEFWVEGGPAGQDAESRSEELVLVLRIGEVGGENPIEAGKGKVRVLGVGYPAHDHRVQNHAVLLIKL